MTLVVPTYKTGLALATSTEEYVAMVPDPPVGAALTCRLQQFPIVVLFLLMAFRANTPVWCGLPQLPTQ